LKLPSWVLFSLTSSACCTTNSHKKECQTLKRSREIPEVPLLLWGGLINFAWEMVQAPLFEGHARHLLNTVWECFLGTVGDCLILLASFWITSSFFRTRGWFAKRRIVPKAFFVVIGIAYTIFSEWYHTHVLQTWEYGPSMPLVLGIGLAPLAQWFIIPPVVLALMIRTCKRQEQEP
jgi:hypothetical protein